jgi:hypothetical protein
MRQRKISQNLGKDTHVRNQYDNRFKPQAHGTYTMIAGEIEFPQPEPLFKQNLVTVKFARGGRVSTVAYPGAFISPLTGQMHGLYEGPIPGQMVMVGFENGNSAAPFVVNRYPYQGVGDTFSEMQYLNPLTTAGIDATDVAIGHFSGSFLRFNTGIISGKLPGSISFYAISSVDMSANLNIETESGLETTFKSLMTGQIEIGTGVTITGATAHSLVSDLTGEISVGSLIKIANSAYGLNELIAGLITAIQGITTTNCVVGAPVVLNPASIAALESEKAKFALLLE